ncbi:hypothetical protein GCM10010411_76370 [Actinomadura fulvescens]|uniref:CCHC-type domain-containing protein n=1 Tax=Actinomadura fulvescens TaxID=46160 RepID=A0ABP6CW13_9ACTN
MLLHTNGLGPKWTDHDGAAATWHIDNSHDLELRPLGYISGPGGTSLVWSHRLTCDDAVTNTGHDLLTGNAYPIMRDDFVRAAMAFMNTLGAGADEHTSEIQRYAGELCLYCDDTGHWSPECLTPAAATLFG